LKLNSLKSKRNHLIQFILTIIVLQNISLKNSINLIRPQILFLFLIILFFSCSNPIQKKQKELQNCKISVVSTEIKKFNFLLLPPVPKIQFNITLLIENTNDVEVTIEKFTFKILTKISENADPMQIAIVDNKEEIILPPLSKKEVILDLITILEENPDKDVLRLVLFLGKQALQQEAVPFILDGSIEYNSFIGKMNIPFTTTFKTRLK
jgi:hypothetical protein